jgi:hypothetical protein
MSKVILRFFVGLYRKRKEQLSFVFQQKLIFGLEQGKLTMSSFRLAFVLLEKVLLSASEISSY